MPVGVVQLPLTLPLINLARLPARHRQTHDLFVEVHDPKCELTGTEHLRQALQINAIHAPWIQRLETVARGWVITTYKFHFSIMRSLVA